MLEWRCDDAALQIGKLGRLLTARWYSVTLQPDLRIYLTRRTRLTRQGAAAGLDAVNVRKRSGSAADDFNVLDDVMCMVLQPRKNDLVTFLQSTCQN